MAEWLKAPVLKTGKGATSSRVRIPLSPPNRLWYNTNYMNSISTLSLFSSAGIDKYYLDKVGVDIRVANELLQDRANLFQKLYKHSEMIPGDIGDKKVFDSILKSSKKNKIDFIIATPPCQGVSLVGKNKSKAQMAEDERNHLVFYLMDLINKIDPSYVLIENVPRFLKLNLMYKNEELSLLEILKKDFSEKYVIDCEILNTKDYGVPQDRKRAIIKMYKRSLQWGWPKKEKEITVREAIGHLPSLESGESSDIPWHYAREHTSSNILWMLHTPEGQSAFKNKVHFPEKKTGERIKGFAACYARMRWDKPAPTITMRNDCIASQRNVHPGTKLKNGKYSDARVLTPLELFILSSLPKKNRIPKDTPERLIRHCIGEGIPPLFMKKICKEIQK